jgi:hypothetical protein
MMRASWTGILCGAIATIGSAATDGAGQSGSSDTPDARPADRVTIHRTAYQRGRAGRGLSVRWIGQDGHDYVSASTRLEPDDRQDIHIAVGGLDPRREITRIDVSVPWGHKWQYNPEDRNWHVALKRDKGAAVADLFVQADRPDFGPVWHILVRYDDGSTAEADLRSRKVNPFLRVASTAVQARWVGQDRHDFAATGPGVGPDGLQDARIHLGGLSPKIPVKSIRIEAASGSGWEFGMNPRLLSNAELIKDPKDPKQGDLYFQPDRDLAGQRLRMTLVYEDGSPDAVAVAAGRCDARLRMSQAPVPKVEEMTLTARWLGQDRSHPSRPGDIHILLGGLPGSARIAAISLTDTVREAWQYRASDRVPALLDGSPGSLDVRIRPDRKTVDLYFTPYRDASRDTFSVRVVATDGRTWHGLFPGGPCDLTRIAPAPEPSRAQARPGDDLQALLDRNGTVVLAKGTYRLRHPLVLNRPATLTSEAGVTLVFAQDPNDQPWTTAVKVRCSNTTLDGFAVRFEGRIRWNPDVSYGPAVIGLTDSFEPGHNDPKSNVVFRNLDLEIPPADDPSKWVEALRLYRLVGGSSGAIIGNRLRGGPIEFFHGPWQILDNDFRGTPPGTFSHNFVVGHYTHDLLIRGNRLSSPSPSGKTWRFLVLTGSSLFDRIERNVIEGVGARDNDTIPWSNEPEIILTENYLLKYEGKVLAASADGKVLRVGPPQGPEVKPGDVVAILNGPAAGQWRRVQHVLDPSAYLIDQPLPKGSDVVSISQAFVSEVFEGNRIDIRGGKRSDGFVLVGNHFGTRVSDNHILGGGLAWRVQAFATENPMIWGWSHVPYMGGVIERNIAEDTDQGASLCVEHSAAIKTNKGRTYMSMQLRDNVVRWSEHFVSRRVRAGTRDPLPGLTVGCRPSADPNELLIEASGNGLDAPPGYRDLPGLVVHAAQFNGQKVVDRKFKLPAAKGPGEGGRREARTIGPRPVR